MWSSITAPADVRHARSSAARDAGTGRLLADKQKAKRADYAYVNTGSLADLDAFVASVVQDLNE